MAYDSYSRLKITRQGARVTALVDNPPVNLMTLELYSELSRLSLELEADPEVRVFVLKSANPDFFIAHFDVAAILGFPVDRPTTREAPGQNDFHAMCRRFGSMKAVTIAQIEGRVGGGGSELVMGFDMRFGVRGQTRINQMEVPLGILPGGTGTQQLPRLIGRARALEVILGGGDLDAETAAAWGYLNRSLGADEIGPFVDDLAALICAWPAEAVTLAKQAVSFADGPLPEGLAEESYRFQVLIRDAEARRNMQRFLDLGGQTRDGEIEVEQLSRQLAGAPSRSRIAPD
jgi:enoyl-CoA hydratase/carnithine racemase